MATETTNNKKYNPDFATPPGETLQETIEELGMDQRELATRLGMAHKTVNQIIHGKAPITHETAIGLERVTSVPASFWANREAIYRERLVRMEEAKSLEDDLEWLSDIPTTELRKRGFIKAARKGPKMLEEVLTFFGTNNTSAWRNYWKGFTDRCRMSARKSVHHETRDAALATWIRIGEIGAQKIDCKPFDLKRFKDNVCQIRDLTTLLANEFISKMESLCADAGVALVLVPKMAKVPWNGACWWMTPKKAVIELNLRGKTEDQFWFSFFHEAGHIVKQHGKKAVFINSNADYDSLEKEADEFATNTLVPKSRRDEIIGLGTKQAMQSFANEIGISPGIVAGQYQHITQCFNYQWLHDLKRRFEWNRA